MRRLLVRPIPYSDESPGSVILRASSLNGWKSVHSFLKALDVMPADKSFISFFQNKSKWAEVMEKVGIEAEGNKITYERCSISKRSLLDFNGIPVSYPQLRLHESAICSKCIREKQYARRIWDFNLITACSIHKNLLLTTCKACQKKISWNRPDLLTCQCGQELESYEKDKQQLHASLYVENLIKQKDIDEINRLQKIFNKVGQFISIFYLESHIKVDLITFAVGIVLVKPKIKKLLLKILQFLANERGVHPRIALYLFLDSKYDKNEIFFHQVLEIFKVKSYGKLDQSIENRSVTTKEASNALGVSGFIVKKFIQNDVLKAHKKKNNGMWYVNLSSINNLLVLLSNGSRKKMQYVPFSMVLKTPKFTNDLVSLVKDTAAGNKKYSKMELPVGIMSVYIEMDLVETKVKDYVSVKYLAGLCGIHPGSIYFCIQIGFLKRINSEHTKGRKIFIKRKVAEAFNDRYTFISTLAKKYNLNSTNLAEKIMGLNINPVSGPKLDGNLTYIFKKSDLKNVNFEALAKLKDYPTITGRKANSNKPITKIQSITIRNVKNKLNLSIGKINKLINHKVLIEKKSLKREKEVTQESFDSLHKILSDNSLVSFADAIKKTKEAKYSFLRRWVYTDFISLIDIKIEKYININDLKKIINFKKKYVTSEEGGVMTKTNRSYLPNLEKIGKIEVSKILKGSGQPVKFYLRADVVKILSDSE